MKVICVSGKARHGKDTFAEFLKNNLEFIGNRVLILHYADQLKFICQKYYGWNGEKDQAGRTLLQMVGTDYARSRDPEVWVKYVALFLRVFGPKFDYIIIPDCRFPNEIDWLRGEHDMVSVLVERPGFDNGLTPEQKKHPSETSLDGYDGFDFFVDNNGTLAELDVVAGTVADRIMDGDSSKYWFEARKTYENENTV